MDWRTLATSRIRPEIHFNSLTPSFEEKKWGINLKLRETSKLRRLNQFFRPFININTF
ncbi:hypothetical protein CISIN_1g035440mg [Citrus sinensis]|uniref:Uncharacterized protein n=1 Tax=Citrus sinensis TaxID=2711 RepID=A0A067DSE5_CITSI|nr:hypothetical protein CISIN_1g035440mg [Citrus sinensis]